MQLCLMNVPIHWESTFCRRSRINRKCINKRLNLSPPSERSWGQLAFNIGLAIVIVGLLITYSMVLQVSEGTNAVVTRFGNPVREVTEPGLHWKAPVPIEQAHVIDMRKRIFNTPFTATLTKDRKNVIILTYVVWRVEEPLLFLQSVGTPEMAENKLKGMVTYQKNFHFGNYDLSALISTDKEQIQTPNIEKAILESVQPGALEKFGIAVEQVGIKRIAFPEENSQAVLAAMRAERKAEADLLRAEGQKQASIITNDALVKKEQLQREGREIAGKIRGEAEEEAAKIYAKAHSLDPEFYRFWRSLEALKRTLGAKATVVLRTDQGLFGTLTNLPTLTPPKPAEKTQSKQPETKDADEKPQDAEPSGDDRTVAEEVS